MQTVEHSHHTCDAGSHAYGSSGGGIGEFVHRTGNDDAHPDPEGWFCIAAICPRRCCAAMTSKAMRRPSVSPGWSETVVSVIAGFNTNHLECAICTALTAYINRAGSAKTPQKR